MTTHLPASPSSRCLHRWKLPPDKPTCRGRCVYCGLTKHFPRGTYYCPGGRHVTKDIISVQLSPWRWRHRCPTHLMEDRRSGW
jgi:hypothetical protein